MATYSAVSASEKDADSPITVGLIDKLDQNPHAIAEGAAGAPKILTAAINDGAVTSAKLAAGAALGNIAGGSISQAYIGASAIGQGQLKTATATHSGNRAAYSTQTIVLTGGSFGWWGGGVQNSGNDTYIKGGFSDTSAQGNIRIVNTDSSPRAYAVWERYVQASPPYDLGDGEVLLFMFAVMNSDGTINDLSVAQDPPWAYNGPTDIRPDSYDKITGKRYKRVKTVKDTGLTIAQAKKLQPRAYAEAVSGARELAIDYIEITHEFKNADMAEYSSPWSQNPKESFAGQTIIMLSPFSKPVQRLFDIYESLGAREVVELINSGEFVIDNTADKIRAPAGVMPCRFRWKLTGQK